MDHKWEQSSTKRRLFHKIIIALFFLASLLFFLYLPLIVSFEEKSINVYMFTEYISSESIRDFEKQTGIKVYVQYYDSNEEMYAKFKINEGIGYDLIAPSDYMVELMGKDGLLQKIDHTKLSHFKELDPALLNHYFDQGNNYSIPITWTVYGIIYDTLLLTNPHANVGFEYLFKKPESLVQEGLVKNPYHVCMYDDPREAFLIAAHFLLGKIHDLSEQEFAAVEKLLVKQKKWVECYTNFGLRYFLEGNIASVAVTSSRYVGSILNGGSGRFKFKIPESGGLFVIENFAIPVHSKKAAMVHKFIDFMISRKYCTDHFNEYGGNPVNKNSYQDIDQQFLPSKEVLDKLFLVNNELPLRKIEEMWLRVKTA